MFLAETIKADVNTRAYISAYLHVRLSNLVFKMKETLNKLWYKQYSYCIDRVWISFVGVTYFFAPKV